MALNATDTKEAIVAAVEVAFAEKFPEEDTPDTTEAIATAMGEVIAEVVDAIFAALTDDAEISGVTSGGDTVGPGVIS